MTLEPIKIKAEPINSEVLPFKSPQPPFPCHCNGYRTMPHLLPFYGRIGYLSSGKITMVFGRNKGFVDFEKLYEHIVGRGNHDVLHVAKVDHGFFEHNPL